MAAHKKERDLAHSYPPTNPQPHPWLLISHGYNRGRHIFYSISEDRYYPRSIPQLCNKKIHHSCFGWVILEDLDMRNFSLLNMVSMEVVQVIPQPNFEFIDCILSSPPSDPDCRLVLFDTNSDDSSTIYFCKLGDSNFERQDLRIDGGAFYYPTIFQGTIYGLIGTTSKLVRLDFSGPIPHATVVINVASKIPPYVVTYLDCFLIEFSSKLFLVEQAFEGEMTRSIDRFSIFLADFTQNTWIKVKSIGENCALFLTPSFGMSCRVSPESGIKGNVAYFMYYENRCLYSFDLLDQSFSIYPPCPNVSRYESSFYWISMDAS